ncbi:MAG: hypothetical protein HYX59_10700 [Elusimicrobia bacterium]|nr:hypothetical protein [Elusimicrobiota bacterium]
MNKALFFLAALLAVAAPALRAEDDDADEAPAAEQETEAAPAAAAAPAAEGQALGGTGLRRQKPYKPGQRKTASPAESVGQGASGAEDGEEAEEPVRRRQETRTPVFGGASGAGGEASGGPAPAGITVYQALNYPTFDPIPHKGAHPHFVFRSIGEAVSIRFTGTAGGGWNVSSGTDGHDCNAHLWISASPGGKPVGPACDDDSAPGSPAQNYVTVDFVSAAPRSACPLKAGRYYFVNMMVKSKWGHCSLYLDPMGSVR